MDSRGSSLLSLVLDASVVVAWLLADEDEPSASVVLTRLEAEVALVPDVWHVEVRNALLVAERRRRVRPGEVDDCLRRVRELAVRTDKEPDIDAAFALARTHRLSVYDALYLDLALRAEAPLATLDKALARAADAAGVALIEA